jgi:hypothetical protein
MKSWKKQLLWGLGGTAIATLLFGVLLSVIVNQGLKQLEQQRPDLILPQAPESPPTP